MFTVLMCVVILTATPLSASVVKHVIDSCSPTEFACGDGGCISVELVCDGSRDCADGGDEIACDTGPITLGSNQTVLHRPARQASGCRRDQWTCRDGTCVSFDAKCDGIVDCSDGSDERHALCRKSQCQYNWFRCTYGACVDGTAPCNGKQECADNSDELLPRCRNETDEVRGQFKCQDGSTIPAASHCDGVADCADGSDETVRTCAAKTCHSYLFQCAYGACVDSGSDCNQSVECADGSDEAPDLCNKILPPTTPDKPQKNKCIMPAYPAHGTYVSNVAGAKPDDAYNVVNINVTCREGYGPSGPTVLLCLNGWWQSKMPECILQCQLNPHASVEYICLVTEETVTGTRPCQKYEPDGTAVSPVCRTNYYSSTALLLMRCVSGNWNYIARCSPECGTITPGGDELLIGGVSAKHGEVPWHAGIYTKEKNPYMQICGGSIISNNIIISAAHCFYSNLEKQRPASNYAVAVGKLYRPYMNDMEDAQRSDVKSIHLTVRYQGSGANYQEDIAVVEITTPFEYQPHIRPVCVDFDINFERRQLIPGNMGKVAGWGLTAENGNASQVLKVIDLPYVDTSTCIANSPPDFRAFITSDKICAGYKDTGAAMCKGDSGGGLAFPESDKGTPRYYLRGIVSTAPRNDNLCNANHYTSFTKLLPHEHFIKQFWDAAV